jgi:hypothetical protein
MMNLYLVMAMKRSGHHAFCNWLGDNMEGAMHINNAVDGWEDKQFLCPEHSGGSVTKFGTGEDNLIISVEDFDVGDWERFGFENFDVFKKCKKIYPVLFVRDFRNWLASSIQRKHGDYGRDVYDYLDTTYLNDRKEVKDGRVSLWAKQMAEFETPTIDGCNLVSYNKWLTDKVYRDRLSSNLCIGKNEESMSVVSVNGHGSSFDGYEFKNKALDMGVLRRYEKLEGDEDYVCLVEKYSSLVETSRRFLE